MPKKRADKPKEGVPKNIGTGIVNAEGKTFLRVLIAHPPIRILNDGSIGRAKTKQRSRKKMR